MQSMWQLEFEWGRQVGQVPRSRGLPETRFLVPVLYESVLRNYLPRCLLPLLLPCTPSGLPCFALIYGTIVSSVLRSCLLSTIRRLSMNQEVAGDV